MAKPIYILNGPNLNLLGEREPEIYGRTTLAAIGKMAAARAKTHGLKIEFRQSAREGELIEWVHEARKKGSAIIINAGGYAHTSIALMDALKAAELPVIEVHLSNTARRESFRHHSYVAAAANGVIQGLGPLGYELAVDAAASLVSSKG